MNPVLKVLKNSTLLSVSILFERIAGLVLAWYVARFIGRELWGEYNTVLSFVLIGVSVGPWGLNTLLPREIGRSHEKLKVYLGSSVVIGTAITLILVAILALVVYLIDYPPELMRLIFLALAIAVLPQVEGFLFEAAIIGIERMEWVVIARIPMTILRIGASLLLLHQGYQIRVLFILLSLYHIGVTTIYFIILKRTYPDFKLQPDWEQVRYFFYLTMPFAIATGFTEIFGQVDKVILSKLRDLESVGVYSTGILLIQLIIMLAPSIMDSLFPSLSRMFVQSQEKFDQLILLITKLFVLFFFPLTVVILSLAEFVILFGFGDDYFDSIAVLQIAALIVLPSYVSRLWYRATLASNNEQKGIAVAIVGGLAQIGLNLLLIPQFGLLGAVYALCGTVFIRTIHNFINANSILNADLRSLVLKLFGCIILSGAVYWLLFMADFNVLALGISLIVFGGTLVLSKTIGPDDVKGLQLLQKI